MTRRKEEVPSRSYRASFICSVSAVQSQPGVFTTLTCQPLIISVAVLHPCVTDFADASDLNSFWPNIVSPEELLREPVAPIKAICTELSINVYFTILDIAPQ